MKVKEDNKNIKPEDGTELIALYATQINPSISFTPRGFIRGPPHTHPSLFAFSNSYKRGALLSICWLNGKISFYPLIFSSQSSREEHLTW